MCPVRSKLDLTGHSFPVLLLDVHELAGLSGRSNSQELGGVTAEHISEAGQKQPPVQDENVGTAGGYF
jgi:hypothetical protein